MHLDRYGQGLKDMPYMQYGRFGQHHSWNLDELEAEAVEKSAMKRIKA